MPCSSDLLEANYIIQNLVFNLLVEIGAFVNEVSIKLKNKAAYKKSEPTSRKMNIFN